MEWQLQENRGYVQGWVPVRWLRTSTERDEEQRWLDYGYYGPKTLRIVEIPDERDLQAMTERTAQARIDGLEMGHAMTTVFVAVHPSDPGAIFALGFLLAKTLAYNDADAAMAFTKAFGESFARTAPKQLDTPSSEG